MGKGMDSICAILHTLRCHGRRLTTIPKRKDTSDPLALGFYVSRRTDGQQDIDDYDRLERVDFGGKV
jgi:hypothetical protein